MSSAAQLIKLFNKLDVNGDGELTREEFIKGLKSSKGNAKQLSEMFAQVDFDKSGSISYTEFISALIGKEIYFKEAKMKQAFQLFDKDGDGRITFDELRAILGKQCNVAFSDQYWKDMVKVADFTRTGFMNGDISTVMSPRTVITWAQNTAIFGDPGLAFRMSFLNKCDEAERALVAEYYQRVFGVDLPESVVRKG